MAAAIAMDVDQADSKVAKSSTSLSISKASSSRISKAAIRRPIVQQSKPAPTPKVYNTDPMGFRNLVQELTGYAPAIDHRQPSPPPQPPRPQPVAPDPAPKPSPSAMVATPTGSGGGGGGRAVNTRLQRMAPPPLSPTFSFSFKQPPQQQTTSTAQHQQPSEVVSPSAHPLSPISKRVSPMPLLSFSPLPVLSPTDNIWANFESPNTAAIKKFAQSIAEDASGASSRMGFPWSPTFQACFGMPSPGVAAAPELFPEVKMMDSPSPDNHSSSSTRSAKEFSFPEVKN